MSNSFIMTESIVRPAKMPYGRLKDNGFVGIEGEHAARALVVETKDDLSAFASINLIIDDLDCGAMTKTTSGSTTTLSMTLTSSMIGRSGRKICQLIMVNSGNTVVQKSSQFEAYVGRANEIERSVDDGVTIIILSEAVTEMAREAAAAAAEEAVADVVEDCQAIADAASASADAAAQSASDAQTAAASITVDAALDPTSTHAIQNKAVASEIAGLKADLDDVNTAMVDKLGTSVINASDFTVKTSYVQYAYSESEQSVTLTKTSTAQYNYQALSTPINSLANILTVGKKYRMHYRADVISGTPDIRMIIRKSDNSSASLPLIVEDGEEGYLDFEATAEMSHISVFITYNENVGACKIKYSDIYLCEIEGKIAVDLTARTEIENVRSDLQESIDTSVSKIEEVTADNLGESIIKASNFTAKTQNITYTYNSAEQSVTLTKTSTSQANYQALSTPVDFLVGKLIVGKTYRVHCRADVLSGNPEIRMTIRKSDNKSTTASPLILQDGEDGYVDFVATADMSLVSVFITYNTAVGACQIKYSELYLCEVEGKTAVDVTARTEIEDVRSHLSDASIYKNTILRMMSSMAYNATGASPQIYKDLFSMLLKLKESVSLIAFPAYTASGGKQGACTDGKYIYQCCGDADQYTYMSIIKYNISTREIESTTTFNGTPNFGHANDMAYDPITGYLYICTMLSDGSVIRIDSKDMSYVDTIYLLNNQENPYKVYQIAFDRVTRHLISTVNTAYRIYDPDGTYITTVPLAERISATEQGMETDGVYIYRITYAPSCIDVCDMDGERIVTYNLDISREPETMMYDWMGTYYLTGNGSTDGQFYIADLME